MTDLSKISSEDLIVNYKQAVCNINWRDKANLENYRVLTEELMRRLAVYDQYKDEPCVPVLGGINNAKSK